MNQTTCATIATLIPVLLLAVALEGRGVHVKLRLQKWYTPLVAASLVLGFCGIGFALWGLAPGRWGDFSAGPFFTWIFVILTGLCSFFFLLCVAVSIESEAEAEKQKQALIKKMQKTVIGRLRLRLGGGPKIDS